MKHNGWALFQYGEVVAVYSTKLAAMAAKRSIFRGAPRNFPITLRKVELNPKQPSPRVRKALTKYVRSKNPRIKLPANWSPAQVRVDEHGNVQVKINPGKAGKGRFAKCVKAVEMRGGAYDPRAVCGAMEKRYRGNPQATSARELVSTLSASQKKTAKSLATRIGSNITEEAQTFMEYYNGARTPEMFVWWMKKQAHHGGIA